MKVAAQDQFLPAGASAVERTLPAPVQRPFARRIECAEPPRQPPAPPALEAGDARPREARHRRDFC